MALPIQILPRQKGAGEEFAESVSSAFIPAFEQTLENKTLREALQGLDPNASLEDQSKTVLGLNINPQSKQQALKGLEVLQGLRQKEQQQQINQEQEAQKLQMEQEEGPIVEEYIRTGNISPENYSKLSPTTRRSIINAKAQQPVFEKEIDKLRAQSSNEYYNKTITDSRKSRKLLTEVEIARELNEQGITGLTARNKLADIVGEWIRNPKATEFRARSKQFMEGVKELIGGRITEFEFKFFQNMFPNIEQSQAANESLLGMVELREKAKIQEAKIANEIIKQNGGRIPPDLQSSVDEKMEPYMDEEVNRWRLNSYKAVLKENPPGKDQVGVIDDNGEYKFLPKSQAQEWKDSGRVVL